MLRKVVKKQLKSQVNKLLSGRRKTKTSDHLYWCDWRSAIQNPQKPSKTVQIQVTGHIDNYYCDENSLLSLIETETDFILLRIKGSRKSNENETP